MKPIHALTLSIPLVLASSIIQADTGKLYSADKLSSSMVNDICQDAYGYIWVATEYGVNKFDGYRNTAYMNDAADSTSVPSNSAIKIICGPDSSLYVGFVNGLARYDYDSNAFRRLPFPEGVTPRVSSLVTDRNGDLLIGTSGYGIFRLKKGSATIESDRVWGAKPMQGFYTRLFFDAKWRLWRMGRSSNLEQVSIGKDGRPAVKAFDAGLGLIRKFVPWGKSGFLLVCSDGIARYDYATDRLADAGFDLSAMGERKAINTAFADRRGNIDLGSSATGLMVIRRGSRVARSIDQSVAPFDIHTANVNSVIEDRAGNLWVGCYNKGLLLLNKGNDVFQTWSFSAQNVKTGSCIKSMAMLDDGGVLCLVPSNGLFRFDKGGKIAKRRGCPTGIDVVYKDHGGALWLCGRNEVYRYSLATETATMELTLEGDGLACMADDGRGNYYFSSLGRGIYVYNAVTRQLRNISMNDTLRSGGTLCNDWVNYMYIDRRQRMWLSTANGVCCMDMGTGRFDTMGWQTLLKGEATTALAETNGGHIVVGTNQNLYLYDERYGSMRPFPHSAALGNKAVCAIVPDSSSDVWLSTTDGIWQYDHKARAFISHVTGNGLTTKEYLDKVFFHEKDDRIGFGTADGLTVFSPDNVRKSRVRLGQVTLSAMSIGGKQVGSTHSHYDISNDENTFTMEFSLFDYRNTDNVVFEYRVNNGPWNTAGTLSNAITFNRLPPGDYIIEVRATVNGIYSEGTEKITVSVASPWYLTADAFFVYAMMMLATALMGMVYYNRRKNRELEESKMRFLINATHDMRSPLTLILSPQGKLKQRIADPESRADMDTIERNAMRLLTLMNQILDKRKIDKNQLRLRCRQTDLVDFVNGVIALYRYNATERKIDFTFDHPAHPVWAWIDRSQFDKVVANLLSNAFKYTPDGGRITVCVDQDDKGARLSVTDTGIGLKGENTAKLFDRFYQGLNSAHFNVGGIGIGLNLCKALTLMHGGQIRAENRDDGVGGARFTVTLPTGKAHLKPDEIASETADASEKADTIRRQSSRNITLMVVDDDHDMTRYIKAELSDWYRVDTFPNGKEALKALLAGQYDVVVSDVMMPEMDGVALLRNIKGNANISDIPVILLTSKAEVADRLEGLKRGADAYMSKPFNMEELHVTIDNLVDNVRRLRGKFSGAQRQEERIEAVQVKGNDDALM